MIWSFNPNETRQTSKGHVRSRKNKKGAIRLTKGKWVDKNRRDMGRRRKIIEETTVLEKEVGNGGYGIPTRRQKRHKDPDGGREKIKVWSDCLGSFPYFA